MTADNPRKVADEFITKFNQLVRGEPVDPFGWLRMLDENANYWRQGVEPVYARCRSRKEAGETLFPPILSNNVKPTPGFGIYPLEYMQEGNRIVMIAKGRGCNIYGIPYNNTYFFFFEVVNGKIVRAIEDLDASITMRSICDTHLEEESRSRQ
jgi:ketosteroid isomerase-like protein